ncbi:MAG: hypothetical protein NC084_02165 [Bacteroides sp.]|nr:hypothetical protein [Eubacterium sp.]MCM1419551.1 hypothetical protein [Roseburia sp.]MCM1461500.1 hypothetical protein [Bacteroides sp.]
MNEKDQSKKPPIDFEKYLAENGIEIDDEEEDVYDYLELAETARTKKEALAYAKKAAELEPDNLDAAALIAELSATSPEKLIEKYEDLIVMAEVSLEEAGYFDKDSVGEFWLIPETRPYLRLLDRYADALAQCGWMRLSVMAHEKILELCKNDNLGVRYRLMHLYAFLEDEKAAMDLLERYPENSAQFLLPLSVLYYRRGDLKRSARYLKTLYEDNKDTFKFFSATINHDPDRFDRFFALEAIEPGTIDEFLIAFTANPFLYVNFPTYFDWAFHKLKTMKKKK